MTIRLKDYEKDIEQRRTEKSAVAKHAEQNEHNLKFDQAKILTRETNYEKRMINEAIKIENCPENFNREDDWRISN